MLMHFVFTTDVLLNNAPAVGSAVLRLISVIKCPHIRQELNNGDGVKVRCAFLDPLLLKSGFYMGCLTLLRTLVFL